MPATSPASSKDPWSYPDSLNLELEAAGASIPVFRDALEKGALQLKTRFLCGQPVGALVRDRARLVDLILIRVWREHMKDHGDELGLVAVGGYGRGELHPCSDIDVMILLQDEDKEAIRHALDAFLTFLWDIGLEVGHSTRSLEDCEKESEDSLTVATTLMESRFLCGPENLYEEMRARVGPERMWPAKAFFEAKTREQVARHHRYHDTAYNLEPNVKGSPGGLRDIQMIGWVAKRHFGADTLHELVNHGFLTQGQLDKLLAGQTFLWKIRFALHILTNRREDRLLFDYQVRLAEMLGYEDASYTLAVEQMMQRYYRTVMSLSRLNEMLLQLFQEAILMDPASPALPLNDHFQVKNGYLEVTHDEVFTQQPSALLQIFRLLQKNPELKGVSAKTITLIRSHLKLIDEEFRQNPRNHRLFLEILRAPTGVTHELRRMNRYGVLGLYILAFGRIVGRMQYDLFHAYTVDAHSLFVVSYLRRFAMSKYDHEFPYCSQIMQSLEKPEIAYLAALFHDIAKGRGGDHSELGAVDAEAFCLEQGVSRYDARLVAWLVRQHLILSVTAQKKDISDPQVIHEFASLVGDEPHLDYLYVLTVADVRGTNPNLWNGWRAQLFEEFYGRVKRALRRGLANPIDKDEVIAETQESSRNLLDSTYAEDTNLDALWRGLTDEYFLRYRPEEIAWQTGLLLEYDETEDEPLVAVSKHSSRGGTSVFLYTRSHQHTFARATAALDELGLNILDARIIPTTDGFSLETYQVLEHDGAPISDSSRRNDIEKAIWRGLNRQDIGKLKVMRKATRQVRMFSTPTRIEFSQDLENGRTIMELIAGDRPGLLSEIGKVFVKQRIWLQYAKIMTVGERAEDVFYISLDADQMLDEQNCNALRDALITAIENRQ